ncbi:MAG: alpha/beta fold hydrolase [Chloroflexi bacterium]|nr:alpha/beta fold hydrolase [Chloroflexota bacterium]
MRDAQDAANRSGNTFLAILLGLLALPLALGYLFSHRLTRRHRPDHTRSPAEYGLAFEKIAFRTADGLTLRGWWIPAPDSDRAIITLHGYGGSMDPDVQYVPAFHEAGFNVLMFDFRAHGRSDGRICTIGYLERQDALAAVEFVRGRGIERIGMLGFSMGGIVAMLTAPRCPHVRAVISDGGPARFKTALAVHGVELGVPQWLSAPLTWLTLAVTSLRVGANQFLYEPIRWVGKIAPRPILFIHGDRDQYVPPADFAALVAAAGPAAEVWRVAGAGHRTVDQVAPEEYRRRVLSFFEKHL